MTMSPWFVACCALLSLYMDCTSPRYNRIFAVLTGVLAASAYIMLGLAS